MLQTQKHLFSLPDSLTYLNTAYMAPQLKSVVTTGVCAETEILRKISGDFQHITISFFILSANSTLF